MDLIDTDQPWMQWQPCQVHTTHTNHWEELAVGEVRVLGETAFTFTFTVPAADPLAH